MSVTLPDDNTTSEWRCDPCSRGNNKSIAGCNQLTRGRHSRYTPSSSHRHHPLPAGPPPVVPAGLCGSRGVCVGRWWSVEMVDYAITSAMSSSGSKSNSSVMVISRAGPRRVGQITTTAWVEVRSYGGSRSQRKQASSAEKWPRKLLS